VVRAMTRSDHGRGVSSPSWAHAASQVTSTDQRITAHEQPASPAGRPRGPVQDPEVVGTAALRCQPGRKAAVTVRAAGVRSAPRSKSGAWRQTRDENRGAKGAKTRMLALGRGGRGCPPSIG
jgi:hypothetical protein